MLPTSAETQAFCSLSAEFAGPAKIFTAARDIRLDVAT
jgi:hypothetical protein